MSTRPRRCPCGSGLEFDECCGRIHSGTVKAPTAEALMRSRFSAFAVGAADYLLRSWHPRTRPPTVDLDPDQRWLQLEILETSGGGLLHDDGVVEFRARYKRDGQRGVMQERSRFVRDDGLWTYLDGVHTG